MTKRYFFQMFGGLLIALFFAKLGKRAQKTFWQNTKTITRIPIQTAKIEPGTIIEVYGE